MHSTIISRKQALRYSRHIQLAGFDLDKQEILLNSKVLIIGLGGLGCAASQYLLASGIGNITLVDDDHVDLSNLQRQVLHYESAVGTKKVDSARRTLSQINSEVKLTTIDKRLDERSLSQLVAQHTIVLDCCDNLATRNLLNKVCYANSVALVSGAAIRMEGQVFCVIPQQHSACYQCISAFFGEQNLSCAESGVMSPVVGIVGATQAIEAIKIVTAYGQAAINTLQVYDAMQSHWESFVVQAKADCFVCRRPQS